MAGWAGSSGPGSSGDLAVLPSGALEGDGDFSGPLPDCGVVAGVKSIKPRFASWGEGSEIIRDAYLCGAFARPDNVDGDGSVSHTLRYARVAHTPGSVVDHDPRCLMASVPGSEYGASAFAAARLGVLGVPAIGPTPFALRREERYGLLRRQADGDLGGAADSCAHVQNHAAIQPVGGRYRRARPLGGIPDRGCCRRDRVLDPRPWSPILELGGFARDRSWGIRAGPGWRHRNVANPVDTTGGREEQSDQRLRSGWRRLRALRSFDDLHPQ